MPAAFRVLLVAEPGLPRQAYEQELARSGVAFDVVASPNALRTLMAGAAYSGLLLDLPTWIREAPGGRNLLQGGLERFPVLRLRYNPEQGGIRGVSLGSTVREPRDMDAFLFQECAAFAARPLRLWQRRELVWNLRILETPDQDPALGRMAVSANLSATGGFLVSFREYRPGQALWLQFEEPRGPGRAQALVRWFRPWGLSQRMPGIGVSFPDLTDSQRQTLETAL